MTSWTGCGGRSREVATDSDFGLDSATRAVLQDSLDEYLGEDGERAGLEFGPPPPHAARRGGRETGLVIDFNRAKRHLLAAKELDAHAPGAPMRTAETLRALAEDFRGRARGAPPVRG